MFIGHRNHNLWPVNTNRSSIYREPLSKRSWNTVWQEWDGWTDTDEFHWQKRHKKETNPLPRYPHFHIKMSCVAITFMALWTLLQHCALWEEAGLWREPLTGFRPINFTSASVLTRSILKLPWSRALQWNPTSVTNLWVSGAALVCWEI